MQSRWKQGVGDGAWPSGYSSASDLIVADSLDPATRTRHEKVAVDNGFAQELLWLRYIRSHLRERGPGRSVILEVYPSLWRSRYPLEGVTEHQRDAYAVAAWVRQSDHDGTLASFFNPRLAEVDRAIAAAEGWILGVTWARMS